MEKVDIYIYIYIIRLWGVGPIDGRISISLKNKLRIF